MLLSLLSYLNKKNRIHIKNIKYLLRTHTFKDILKLFYMVFIGRKVNER